MTLLLTLEDSFLQVTYRCSRLDPNILEIQGSLFKSRYQVWKARIWGQMNLWICPILHVKWGCSVCMQMFLRMRAEFSNKKQQNSLLSGAKHIQDICAASWHSLFPSWQQWLQAGQDQQLLARENTTCVVLKLKLALRFFIHRHCGQYCHSLWLWELECSNIASLQQYRWRPFTFTMKQEEADKLEIWI